MRKVRTAFFKLALVRHPDKNGGPTAAFQELLNAYNRTLKHIAENLFNDNLSDEEEFVKDFFKKFNFPKENVQSFTILIQNEMADFWEDVLSENYNDPTINQASKGIQWKTLYNANDTATKISITLWKTPKNDNQSKILIQGGKQSMNTIFVFDELPKIYKSVKERSKKGLPCITNLIVSKHLM